MRNSRNSGFMEQSPRTSIACLLSITNSVYTVHYGEERAYNLAVLPILPRKLDATGHVSFGSFFSLGGRSFDQTGNENVRTMRLVKTCPSESGPKANK